ncbi:MAG: antibiotic biosynthesis monooxygenase [Acidobacteriota bacterium]|nr:antibiotic biosynthesis monooxygenase [Acidobacteriota bacterium]
MFVVLYRWRIKPNLESQFVKNWSVRTAYLREKYDSLGSRLHRGSDGIWYSYAQWKSAEQREKAFASETNTFSEASQKFQEAIEETFPEIQLVIVSDFIILPEKN